MTLHELQEQALRLSAEERWQLINALMQSLQPKPQATIKPKGLAASLIGIAKTDSRITCGKVDDTGHNSIYYPQYDHE